MLRTVNVIFLIFLAGCMQKDMQHALPVKNKWTVAVSHPKEPSKNITCMDWWGAFHDPLLNEVMRKALQKNDGLNMAGARIEAAQGELKKIKYQWIPNVDLFGGYSSNPALGFPGFWYSALPSYTMNLFRQIKLQKIATYQLAQVRAQKNAVKLTVISQVAASYFIYQAELERRRLLAILAKDSAHLAGIAGKVYKAGLTSNIEPQQLYSNVEMVYAQQEIIERNIVFSQNTLHYLIEEQPGSFKTVRHFSELDSNVIIPGQLPLTVLANRPDILVAATRLRATNEGIGLAKSALLPTMQLDLYAGLVAGNSQYTTPKIPIYINDQLLLMPLVRFSVLGDIARARGLNKESYFNYIDTVLNALKNTTNALSAYERLTKRLKRTLKARHYVAVNYKFNKDKYKDGIASYATMLDSKIRLDEMNLKLNQAKLQQLLSIVRLYEELAGGYRVNCVPLKCPPMDSMLTPNSA